ncbi:hypothetical protein FA15DRAFT_675605, partial [Coprinopsis marcescibilis]
FNLARRRDRYRTSRSSRTSRSTSGSSITTTNRPTLHMPKPQRKAQRAPRVVSSPAPAFFCLLESSLHPLAPNPAPKPVLKPPP